MDPIKKVPPINVDYFEDLTGRIDVDQGPSVGAIGEQIRTLREEKGLSLEDLAKLTGCEVSLLEKIENQAVQPQLGTMIRLSKALNSALGHLISGGGDKPYSITRRDEARPVSRSTTRTGRQNAYVYKSLAPDVQGRHMEALMVQLSDVADPDTSLHDGEEFIYVLDGSVDLQIGEARFTLEPGDSAYYQSTTPHSIRAAESKATILAVVYTDSP